MMYNELTTQRSVKGISTYIVSTELCTFGLEPPCFWVRPRRSDQTQQRTRHCTFYSIFIRIPLIRAPGTDQRVRIAEYYTCVELVTAGLINRVLCKSAFVVD